MEQERQLWPMAATELSGGNGNNKKTNKLYFNSFPVRFVQDTIKDTAN